MKTFRLFAFASAVFLPLLANVTVSDHFPSVHAQVSNASAKPSARPIATIPIEVTERGLVFLKARVNGSKPLWFVLDSGASFPFVVDTRRAKDLNLRVADRFSGSGAGGADFEISTTDGVSFNLSGFNFSNAQSAIIALDSIETQAGRPIEGLIGSHLFIKLVVEVDYMNRKMTLYYPPNFNYSGNGEIIPLTMRDDYLFAPVQIESGGKSFEGKFLVDTGGGWVTAILTTPFARANNFPAAQQPVIVDQSLSGLGGNTTLVISRATSLKLGKLTIPQPLIYSSRDEAGALSSTDFDGILGSEILRRFKVIFDFSRKRMILEPNANLAAPVDADMSGIRLRASGEKFRNYRVYQVIPNSPASEAGVRESDVLTSINGLNASRYSMDDIYEMLKQPGREVKLTVRRGEKKHKLRIRLRRMV